ncbi:MAG: hypothetical protein SVU32_07935 [Candidatus Nanohaloarchaea archaeon]|nr:hypothetical protein [Candidatus Nanohaloarchaea archaeon]
MTMRISDGCKNLKEAFQGALHAPRYILLAAALTIALFVVLVLSSFPEYSYQMLSANLFFLDQAVVALTANLYATIGALGLGLMAVYAGLTAVALLHLYVQFQSSGIGTALTGAGGTAPVFLIGGCAGCGAGILGLLGAAGALTLLPFQGNGIRMLGIGLFVFFLGKAGDPRTCSRQNNSR